MDSPHRPEAEGELYQDPEVVGLQQHSEKCPAKEKSCNNCGKLNHFAKMCSTRGVHTFDANTNNGKEEHQLLIESLNVGAANAGKKIPIRFHHLTTWRQT